MAMPISAPKLLEELPRLRRYARVLTGDAKRADCIVEETLARAREPYDASAPDAADTIRLLALLRAVYADQVATSRPDRTQTRGLSMQLHSKARENPETRDGQSNHHGEMLAQLLHLPLEQREVIVLVAVERLSYADISELLSIPTAAVIARLSQAREALRSIPANPRSAPNSAD